MLKAIKKIDWLVVVAFTITMIILTIILAFGGYAPFGNRSLAGMDANIQYLDFFAYLKDVLAGKNAVTYTLSNTLGGSALSLVAYYLTSPLNLLIIFFKKTQLVAFFALLIVLKLSLASATMAYFLIHRFRTLKPLFIILLSISYGLMQYNIAQSSNIMWLDGVYLLPLMLLVVYQVASASSRWYKLAIVVAISLIFNWYTGILNCLFSAFWLSLELVMVKRNSKEFITAVINYAGGMLIGIGLSAFLFLPNLYALVHGSRSEFDRALLGLGFIGNPFELFSRVTIFSVSDPSHTALYCGSFALLGVGSFFLSSEISKRIRYVILLASVVVILGLYWKPLYLLFSLFKSVESYWSRYSYLAIFFVLFVAAIFYSKWTILKRPIQTLMFGGMGTALIILVTTWGESFRSGLITVGFLGLEASMLALSKRQRTIPYTVLLLLLTLELGLNAEKLFSIYTVGAQSAAQYERYMKYELRQIKSIKQDKDNYRILQTANRTTKKQTELTANYNEALAFNYWSIAGYSSNQSAAQLNLLEKLGYRSEGGRITVVNGPILGTDSLLGVKYFLIGKLANTTGLKLLDRPMVGSKKAYLNPSALPMAFTSQSDLRNLKLGDNPFKNQNLIFKRLTNSQNSLYKTLSYTTVRSDHPVYNVATLNQNNPVYGNLKWQVSDPKAQLFVNGKLVTPYTTWLSPSVFNIPTLFNRTKVELKGMKPNRNIVPQFYQLNLVTLTNATRQIKENSGVKKLKVKDGNIKVTANGKANNDNLYLSIPTDRAWQVFNNGEPVKVESWIGGLVMIKLHKGENNLILKYRLPMKTMGAVVSLTSLAFLIITYVYSLLTFTKRNIPKK